MRIRPDQQRGSSLSLSGASPNESRRGGVGQFLPS
jgi:hypothetical protein